MINELLNGCREAFERWEIAYNPASSFTRDESRPDVYLWERVQNRWEAWQASWSQAQPTQPGIDLRSLGCTEERERTEEAKEHGVKVPGAAPTQPDDARSQYECDSAMKEDMDAFNASEIPVADDDGFLEAMMEAYGGRRNAKEAIAHEVRMRSVLRILKPYLRTTEPVSVAEGETAEEIYARTVRNCKLLGLTPPNPPGTKPGQPNVSKKPEKMDTSPERGQELNDSGTGQPDDCAYRTLKYLDEQWRGDRWVTDQNEMARRVRTALYWLEKRAPEGESAQPIDCRAEFEKWCQYQDKHRDIGGHYTHPAVHNQWLGWIAAWNTVCGQVILSAPTREVVEEDYIKVLEDSCWDLRCVDVQSGYDDGDIEWQVIGHWMAKPQERIIGRGSSAIVAIKDAMQPRDHDGNLLNDIEDQAAP